jgi:Cd2+/Zn2+-exporting ATPase
MLNEYSKEEVLKIAASLESKSQHPIAEAIYSHAERKGIILHDVQESFVLEGSGIGGNIDGKRYFIGNHELFEERKCCDNTVHQLLSKIEDENHTAVLLGDEKKLLGIFSISDTVRDTAPQAIQKLKKYGVEHLILLTGDNHRTAEAVAKAVNIDTFYSELLPEDKVRTIKKVKQQFKTVAMVGDGINDAPALAAADIGIAMGASGTDVALETSDIALMKDDLLKIPYLKKLSNFTLSVIKQNIFIALGLKFTFLILALPGWATLWMAVFADMGASLIVIFNGMRVLKTFTKF